MGNIVIKYQEIDNWELLSKDEKKLIDSARDIAQSAYAVYSDFYVGAALYLENKQIVLGNNQENSSFPCGICAERVALFTASTNYPNLLIKSMAITAIPKNFNLDYPVAPCGMCRQVLLECEEKQGADIQILLFDSKKIIKIAKAKDLLPMYFKENKLKRK
tara:strand:+ start:161 stop:643 length:483 start_codon:yes stop_codon:yes gene_type:complete